MKRMSILVAACLAAIAMFSYPSLPQDKQATITQTNLKVGDVAPDFTLPSDQRSSVTLSSFRGKKNVILAFYVLAFTGG